MNLQAKTKITAKWEDGSKKEFTVTSFTVKSLRNVKGLCIKLDGGHTFICDNIQTETIQVEYSKS